MSDKRIFVEQQPDGSYSPVHAKQMRITQRFETQAEAIERARSMTDGEILVERVRNTKNGGRDQWRKP